MRQQKLGGHERAVCTRPTFGEALFATGCWLCAAQRARSIRPRRRTSARGHVPSAACRVARTSWRANRTQVSELQSIDDRSGGRARATRQGGRAGSGSCRFPTRQSRARRESRERAPAHRDHRGASRATAPRSYEVARISNDFGRPPREVVVSTRVIVCGSEEIARHLQREAYYLALLDDRRWALVYGCWRRSGASMCRCCADFRRPSAARDAGRSGSADIWSCAASNTGRPASTWRSIRSAGPARADDGHWRGKPSDLELRSEGSLSKVARRRRRTSRGRNLAHRHSAWC